MKVTSFPNGLPGAYFQGQYVQPNINPTANVYWVNVNSPFGNGDGSAAKPFTNVSYALNYCVPNNGDIIFLAPGHHEDVQDVFNIGVAGVSIIAVGTGSNRASFSVSGTNVSAGYYATAANVLVSNLQFFANGSNTTTPLNSVVTIEAQNCIIDNCSFTQQSATPQYGVALAGLTDDAASNCSIQNCMFNYPTDGYSRNCTAAIFIDRPQDSVSILNNTIVGDYIAAGVQVATQTTMPSVTNLQMIGNFIQNYYASAYCADFGATATGFVDGNRWFANGDNQLNGNSTIYFGINYGVTEPGVGSGEIPAYS